MQLYIKEILKKSTSKRLLIIHASWKQTSNVGNGATQVHFNYALTASKIKGIW